MKVEERVLRHLRSRFPGGIKRVLLVNPPSVSEKDFRVDMAKDRRYWAYPAYGCAVLAGNLREAGYEVEILDLNAELLRLAINNPNDFYYDCWEDLFLDRSENCDLVGVSVMFTMQHTGLQLIAESADFHGLSVIAGGLHPTNACKQVLDDVPQLEFIGLYESDLSFPCLLDAINGKAGPENICQIALKIDGEYTCVDRRLPPKLSQIKKPYWGDIDLKEYDGVGQVGTYHFLRGENRKASSCLAKRGCRAKCSFCSVRSFNGPGVRNREVEDVLDEIRGLKARGISHLTWLDDDLLFDRQVSLELFKGITAIGGITWDASNGLIAACVDEELLDVMVESGCVGFNLGIESGADRILRKVHKPGTTKSFRQCAKLCEKYPKLFIKAFLIMGFPDETLAEMKQTADLAVELKYDWCSLQILNVLPSTELATNEAVADSFDGNFTAGVFNTLSLREREERELAESKPFVDPFTGDLNRIPNQGELQDIWFVMDFRMNYLPILPMEPGPKLFNRRIILRDICDRVTKNNPLGNLFLSIVETKMGNSAEADRRMDLASKYLKESAYWRSRFDGLEIVDRIMFEGDEG